MAQAFLFFIAGYETTASTLNYVSYCLAVHQEIQDKVVQEIHDQIGEVNQAHTYMFSLITEIGLARQARKSMHLDLVPFPTPWMKSI